MVWPLINTLVDLMNWLGKPQAQAPGRGGSSRAAGPVSGVGWLRRRKPETRTPTIRARGPGSSIA